MPAPQKVATIVKKKDIVGKKILENQEYGRKTG
jgi:hypothetical protein